MPRRKKTFTIPLLLTIGGGLLLITAAFMMVLQNTPSPTAPAASTIEHEEDTYPEIPRATLDEAKAAVDAGTAILVDVRDAGSFAESHIPGALSVPLAELEQRLGELDRSQWIITYCT
jgi:3-mercaptopyruvate sulfurtransferase SseA